MSYRPFKEWLIAEKHDIFGFEKKIMPEPPKPADENPVHQVDIEQMMEMLAKHKIAEKRPFVKFVNEVHWGTGTGALRVWLGTGLNMMIDRKIVDLEGQERWITKRIFQINQTGYGGHEDAIVQEVLNQLEWIDEQQLDSPKADFDELEGLVATMASKIRRTARDIFIFEGVMQVDVNTYIIRLGVRGQGVEAQDQQRVEENQTVIHFNKDTGVIRLTNYNVESPVGSHKWELLPNDTDIYFAPTQARDEITETIANTLHWY